MGKVIQFGGNPGGGGQKRRRAPQKPVVPPEDTLPEAEEVGTALDKADVAAKSERTARAGVAMLLSGAPYTDIAETLDYASPAAARMACEKILAEAYDEKTDYKSLRNVMTARLDKLLLSLSEKALDSTQPDHLPYAKQFLSVVDRQIKLHGIDAPQMITVVNPSAEEFERVIDQMTQRARESEPQEADIVVFEQVDGDLPAWEESDEDPDDDSDSV